jgi:hypothetical protein
MSHETESEQFTAEIVAWDPNRNATRTLYFAMRGFTSSPTDTPDNTHFDGVLTQPAVMSRTMFAPLATKGRSTTNYGGLVLRNENALLDRFAFYRFDGRQVTIRRGPEGGAYPTDFTTDLVGTLAGPPEITQKEVTLMLRDRQASADIPIQPTKYTGAGLGTLEGVAGDLKGKPKPVLFGKVENISPLCVETAKLIYQIHDGANVTLQAVRDRGVALTDATGSYASTTALLDNANAPAAGQFKIYSGSEGTYFRLGSQPDGLVTCDATEGSSAGQRYAGTLFTRILTRAGFTSSDWNASDITTLDTAAAYVLGDWIDQEENYPALLDRVAGSVGAAWFVDAAGDFRIKQLLAPTGTPVITFTEHDLVKPLQRVVTNDHGKGRVTYKTIVRYRKNFTVQDTDLATSVTQANREFFGKAWREAVDTDATVQTASPLAVQDEDDSLLTLEADASAEADRRQTLRGVSRDLYELVVKLYDNTAALELNDVIELSHPRYHMNVVGSDDGALLRIIGLEPNAKDRELKITAWGLTQSIANRITQDGVLTYRVTQSGAYRTTQAA